MSPTDLPGQEMEQLLCGPGEVFGLEPAADEWAISECSEDVAVGGIGLLFTLCFLRRRRPSPL